MTANTTHIKPLVFLLAITVVFAYGNADAAPREGGGNAKMVSKLQTMVKEITTERDLLKTEKDKVTAELEQLKTQVKQLESDKAAAVDEAEKLNTEITEQKSSNDEIRQRLDNTTAKLHEVIDKYNALNKSKNELTLNYAKLQNNQQNTSSELKLCESRNVKMYEGAKEIIKGYQSCQNKGLLDTLIDSEPVTQINNVEFETIIQTYEDKLNKQKYQAKTSANNPSPAASTQENTAEDEDSGETRAKTAKPAQTGSSPTQSSNVKNK